MLSNHLILCCPLLCPLSFPALGSFPMSELFASGDPSIGASASASVLPMNIQCWIPLLLTSLISLLSKGLSGVFTSITVPKHQFFGTQPSLWSNSHICTWLLEKSWLMFMKREHQPDKQWIFCLLCCRQQDALLTQGLGLKLISTIEGACYHWGELVCDRYTWDSTKYQCMLNPFMLELDWPAWKNNSRNSLKSVWKVKKCLCPGRRVLNLEFSAYLPKFPVLSGSTSS